VSDAEHGYGGFVGNLEPGELRALSALGRHQTFTRGATLLAERQFGDRVMVLLDGRVKLTRVTSRGRDVVLGFRSAGDLLGELSAIDEQPRSAAVTAIEDVRTLTLAARDFRQFLAGHPHASIVVMRLLVERLRDADNKRVGFASSDTVARVASRLVELTERFGTPAGEDMVIDLPLTQEELAGWCGASLESTAKALRVLRDLGYISTQRRVVTVHAPVQLRARADVSNDMF
jgi:CRP-like cAMP-binding protein